MCVYGVKLRKGRREGVAHASRCCIVYPKDWTVKEHGRRKYEEKGIFWKMPARFLQ